LPVLSVLGTFARGTTTLSHVAHVRLKESDRVSAMLQLNRMGGRLELAGDRLVCHGVAGLNGADLSSFNDHRVLMSLAVAATRAEGESRLTYPHAYRISYPRFLQEMAAVGLSMDVESRGLVPGLTVPAGAPAAESAGSPARAALVPIGDQVRRWSLDRPEAAAVVEVGAAASGPEDRVLTWQELDHRADQVATFLLGLGVGPGEPVAYQLPNCRQFVVLTLAALRIGAVCCPLMPIFRGREMAFMLSRSQARVLVVPDRFRGRDYPSEVADLVASEGTRAGAQRASLSHVVVVGGRGPWAAAPRSAITSAAPPDLRWHDWAEAVEGREPDEAALTARVPGPDALAQLLFTSGTSGEPKGVLHRMSTLTLAAAMEVRHLGLNEVDRVYVPSPLAHQTGFLYGMWLAWVLGAPQILQATWDGRVALAALRRSRGTFVQAATPFLADLTQAAEEAGERPEALRIFVATGAAVPRGLAERATRTLGAAVCGAWGTTESCLGSLSSPGDEPAKTWGTDGRALEGVKLRVTDDDGRTLAAGQEGNFEVKSKCLFEGYLDHPEWTA
ncbi:MAG: AMP-binding protein, partial [Acidimicrobiales bacterium]